MEDNKEIYAAKVCKIVDTMCGTKKLEIYDEKIIVIKESNNLYKEIITGIDFKKYPKYFYHLNQKEVYIFLDKRIDCLKEGYDLIKNYYEEKNENDILHMFKWFNMNEVDRYRDYVKRFESNNFDYETINNELVKSKMKNLKRN